MLGRNGANNKITKMKRNYAASSRLLPVWAVSGSAPAGESIAYRHRETRQRSERSPTPLISVSSPSLDDLTRYLKPALEKTRSASSRTAARTVSVKEGEVLPSVAGDESEEERRVYVRGDELVKSLGSRVYLHDHTYEQNHVVSRRVRTYVVESL